VDATLKALRQAVQRDDDIEIRRVIAEAIPEFAATASTRITGPFRPQVIRGGRTP
jgi:hypothetical protein